MLTSEEIGKIGGAFAAFWQAERQGQGDDKAWAYLFDVLLRSPAEQQAEIDRWLESHAREIARRLPDVEARVQKEREAAQTQLDGVTALRGKLKPA